MINATDLRIGNLFEWNILASMGRGIDCVSIRNFPYSDFFEPVPITEEWLKDMGFKRAWNDLKTHVIFIYDGKISIVNMGNEWSVALQSNIETPRFIRYIKHIHEFQNIIHSLTGEDLIKK